MFPLAHVGTFATFFQISGGLLWPAWLFPSYSLVKEKDGLDLKTWFVKEYIFL